ncbi:MAG: glycosyltransferase family 4 protein [Prolixibacteraceae bacterium]|nr:glycosyltransferase family 4 protein [Prolixibacteraceae bacterium]
MTICIFHYHLNPGGVSRIIESQIDALQRTIQNCSVILLTGYCPNKHNFIAKGVKVIESEILNYLDADAPEAEKKLRLIEELFAEYLSKDYILHFHNLNLGKNPLVTIAAYKLARNGYRLVNHAHDFSEDRPKNQEFIQQVIEQLSDLTVKEIMYPNLGNYHYAVLNQFDLERLFSYGVNSERCHLLPNPVSINEDIHNANAGWLKSEIRKSLEISDNMKIITYPVRVIRRKNIAEFVLLSVLFKDESCWVVTQPPKNPVEIEHNEKWKSFCRIHAIEIKWEAGNKVDFGQLLAESDLCITTSIREGFGMAFMEPWLFGTPVIGRNLPMVTTDLKSSGMEFPLLYDKLFIDGNKNEIHQLSVHQQMQVVDLCLKDKSYSDSLFKMNPFLKDLLKLPDESVIKKNKGVILEVYSVENYGKKLDGIYRTVIN